MKVIDLDRSGPVVNRDGLTIGAPCDAWAEANPFAFEHLDDFTRFPIEHKDLLSQSGEGQSFSIWRPSTCEVNSAPKFQSFDSGVQIKAFGFALKVVPFPVSYRRRIGTPIDAGGSIPLVKLVKASVSRCTATEFTFRLPDACGIKP